MNIRTASIIAFGTAVAAILYLAKTDHIFSTNPVSIIIQACAVALMIWARLTFGIRSFHAAATTTKGELVTSGPYRWLRHPIYAAVIYFFTGSVIAFPFLNVFAAFSLIIAGLFARMLLEEKSLKLTYDNYAEYCKKTRRIIPFIF